MKSTANTSAMYRIAASLNMRHKRGPSHSRNRGGENSASKSVQATPAQKNNISVRWSAATSRAQYEADMDRTARTAKPVQRALWCANMAKRGAQNFAKAPPA